MTAFLVSLGTINALLTYGAGLHEPESTRSPIRLEIPGDCGVSADGQPVMIDFGDPEHRTDIGRILLEANAESLDSRYGAGEGDLGRALAASFAFQPSAALLAMDPQAAAGAIIGAADCFDYQACESPAYDMSLAQWIVAAIRKRAAGRFAPDGAWNMDDSPAEREATSAAAKALETAPTAANDGEAAPSTRASLAAKLGAALTGEALPDAPTAPDPAPAPKPEPETAAKAAAKAAKGKAKPAGRAKARLAPAERADRLKAKEGAKRIAARRKASTKGAARPTPAAPKRQRKAASPA